MRARRYPLRVLVDVDGVLSDFFAGAKPILHEYTGVSYDFETLKTWDIFENLPKEIEDACFARFAESGFCGGLEVLPGAQEGLAKVQALANVYIVTSPMHTRHWVYERTNWLEKHFNIPRKKIIQAPCKYVVDGDILVDDRAENIREWAEHHPDGTGVLWAAPHNLHEPIPENVVRLSQWDDVVTLIEKIKGNS